MPRIEVMYAFITTEKSPEDEGVVAMRVKDTWMPLVGADPKRVDSLRPIAQRIAKATKKRIVLAKFKVRENVEVIEP